MQAQSRDPSNRSSPRDGAAPAIRRRELERRLPVEIHVIPNARAATWVVCESVTRARLSEHTSETDAEAAAHAHGAQRVVVYDRYHRPHDLTSGHATVK